MDSSSLSVHSQDIYSKFPKVELHRHLEGSIRLATVCEITERYKQDGLPLLNDLAALVQIQKDDELNYSNFLSKFLTLRYFYLTPEIIQRVAYEAVEDAAIDGVEYLELRFTPTTLGRIKKFPMAEVMEWVINSALKASKDFGIETRLIASVNRHESVEIAEEIGELAVKHMPQGVVGLDLAGNEAQFPADPFIDMFRKAKTNGLSLTIHAGEWAGAENVRQALSDFQADRIGHGVRIMEDGSVVELARQKKIIFEVCITSNYQSGIIKNLADHPLRKMMDAGLNVTLNTDDPSISDIKLSDEYRVASQVLGLPLKGLAERVLDAAKASFLPAIERQQLVDHLQKKITQLL